uniref:Putative secreted protein n=1 Tax=Amblyomma americanum TaxID=6943 RepID=A0A0C9R5N0_AMBAM
MRFTVLACVLALAGASFDYTGKASLEDATKFFAPNQATFLYERSYSRQVSGKDMECIYMYTLKIPTPSEIELVHGFIHEEEVTNYPLKMKLSRGPLLDEAPVMEVSYEKGLKEPMKRIYHFHYYDQEARCAVITFNDTDGVLRCELHIWNAGQKQPSTNCKRE